MKNHLSRKVDQFKTHEYKTLGTAILCQVFGTFAMQAIEQNGLLILYLRALGLSASFTLSLLSGFSLIQASLRVPSSHIADSVGRKRLGLSGTLLGTASLIMIALSGFLNPSLVRGVVITTVLLLAFGEALFSSGWFSVLHPIIPNHRRGAFFGLLRFSWQSSGIILAAVSSFFLHRYPEVWMYQIVFGVIAAGAFTRALLYTKLPQLESPGESQISFGDAVKQVFEQKGFSSYMIYIFVRFLFVGAILQILVLLEKEAIGLSDGTVVMLANIGLIGHLAGFIGGSFSVDKLSRKPFFVVSHGLMGLIILLFPLRTFFPTLPIVPVYALLHFIFGFFFANFSVAMTAEEFSLIRTERKALAFSFSGFAFIGGKAVSRFFSSFLLHPGVLPENLTVFGGSFSNYDLVLIIFGICLILTLPLTRIVPGVKIDLKEKPNPWWIR